MENMEETGVHPTVLVRPTVMVIDDAEEMLMIMESILSKEYSVKTFSDAKEAIEYAFSNPPDLFLLDVMMPDIDGFETCRRLKANPKLRDIPVIFLTSKNEDEYEEKGFALGASDFIHKPINAPIVIARVKTHLKIKFVMDYMRNENLRLKENAKHASAELTELTRVLWSSLSAKS
jgi:putative two-component system response regulator